MEGEDRKRWEVLCEQATTEADPRQFMELIRDSQTAKRELIVSIQGG